MQHDSLPLLTHCYVLFGDNLLLLQSQHHTPVVDKWQYTPPQPMLKNVSQTHSKARQGGKTLTSCPPRHCNKQKGSRKRCHHKEGALHVSNQMTLSMKNKNKEWLKVQTPHRSSDAGTKQKNAVQMILSLADRESPCEKKLNSAKRSFRCKHQCPAGCQRVEL